MAKFLKVHHVNAENKIEEYIVNLETITAVDEDERTIDLCDGESICFSRQHEWNKLMAYVARNTYEE